MESHDNLPARSQLFGGTLESLWINFCFLGLTCYCRDVFRRAALGSLCSALHSSSRHSSPGEAELMVALQTSVTGGQWRPALRRGSLGMCEDFSSSPVRPAAAPAPALLSPRAWTVSHISTACWEVWARAWDHPEDTPRQITLGRSWREAALGMRVTYLFV